MPIESVQFLADYYATATGSTLDPTTDPSSYAEFTGAAESGSATVSADESSYTGTVSPSTTDPFSYGKLTGAAESGSATGSASGGSHTSTVGSFSSTSSNNVSNHGDGGPALASATIGGIGAGAGVLVCAVAGVIVFFCLRSRKRKRLAASQAIASHASPTHQPPPMQQQQQQQQTGYQSVPQQDSQFQGSPDYQPTHNGYYGGPTDPQKNQGAYSHVSPIESPSPSTADPRPFSMASSPPGSEYRPMSLSPPVPGTMEAGSAVQEYYKRPISPVVTEVDGTQGNPGVPQGQQLGRMEVDGTGGNPGVPHDQQHYHGPYEMH